MKYLPLILPLLLMFGCATQNDVKLQEQHRKAHDTHVQEQTKQIADKSTAIKDVMVIDCTGKEDNPYCIALSTVMKKDAAEAIAGMESQPFSQDKPTLGTDVQFKGIDKADRIIAPIIHFKTVETVAENGGNTYKNDGDVVDSGNRQETHTTTVGDENSGNSSAAENSDQNNEVEEDEEAIEENITEED